MAETSRLPKGYAWEYRVGRALFLAGWYVRRSVDLRERVNGSPQTMAEVDLLAVHMDSALRQRVLVGECKNRKGSAKEADRVVWLLGLSRMLGASEILFAKTRIADGTIRFARPHGLYLWDESAVRAIERRHGLDPDHGFLGSSNVALREETLNPARRGAALRGSRLRNAWEFLAGPFWYTGNVARVKRLAGYFGALEEAQLTDPVVRSSFVAEGLVALLACACVTAGEFARMSPARATARQEDAFAAGAADAHTLREIGARADAYYRDVLGKLMQRSDSGVRALSLPRLSDELAKLPSWLAGYLQLAQRFGDPVSSATDVLRYADLLLFEQHVAGNDASEPLLSLFDGPRPDLRAGVEAAALFLQRLWRVEDPLLDAVLRKTNRTGSQGDQGAPQPLAYPERTSDPGAARMEGQLRGGDSLRPPQPLLVDSSRACQSDQSDPSVQESLLNDNGESPRA